MIKVHFQSIDQFHSHKNLG